MALLFVSAASMIPRFIEYCGETNSIVTEYMKKSDSPDERIRQTAWNEAINRIKRHGAWHSGLVVIKAFGDGTFLFILSNIIYEWFYELFLFLRQICPQSIEELVGQASTIKDRVMGFHKNLMEMNKLVIVSSKAVNTAVSAGGNAIISECADGRLSPINLLKHLWKVLNSSYSYVLQWLLALKGQFTFEMTKYAIQICGCISYYWELLDKVWHFGLN